MSWSRILKLVGCVSLIALTGCGVDDEAEQGVGANQGRALYASWGASAQSNREVLPFPGAPPPNPPQLSNQTVRQIVHLTLGGEALRVHVSNLFGSAPLSIDAASVARSSGDAAIETASLTSLTFGGAARATVAPGAELWSDLAPLATEAESDLAISFYISGQASVDTTHSLGIETTFVSAGNQVSAAVLPPEDPAPMAPRQSYYWLTGVDVARSQPAQVVVAFGDSITDGLASTLGENRRYPNVLARRLNAGGARFGVVNQGISGNRVLNDVVGPAARSRFERDTLGASGVAAVIVLIGINDIGFSGFVPEQEASVERLTAGLAELFAQAKGRNLRTYAATLLPLKGTNAPYYSETSEQKRQAVNAWIRTQSDVDGVIDFDQAMGDPADPLAMRPAYDSGDHLHPQDAGYEAMANAIDLALFDD